MSVDYIMKTYVENAYRDGGYRLVCQYYGISAADLASVVLEKDFIAYELPKSQCLERSWSFRLYLASGEALVFTSKYTGIGGWDEQGSISIEYESVGGGPDPSRFVKVNLDKFHIVSFGGLVYEEGNVYAESGIYFTDIEQRELIIISAAATCAVSVKIPGVESELDPEFSMSDYKKGVMSNA